MLIVTRVYSFYMRTSCKVCSYKPTCVTYAKCTQYMRVYSNLHALISMRVDLQRS